MPSKNIVIAPCGNKAYLFKESWLKQKQEKQFDLCLLFYHEKINVPERYSEVDFFFHLKGYKFHMIYELLTKIHPEWLETYDYFYFLDDDIEIDTRQINAMFAFSRAFGIWISQASLTADSFCSWPMFKRKSNSFCRYVGQIEVMSPLFSSYGLKKCMETFISNQSSWGIDSVWSKLLGYPKDRLIVFGAVIKRHTLPVGVGELYQKLGISPKEEWFMVTDKYDAKRHNYQEYGRLQLVNKKNNRFRFFLYKCGEFFATLKQNWRDYGFMSRVKSRKNKLLKKGKLKSDSVL